MIKKLFHHIPTIIVFVTLLLVTWTSSTNSDIGFHVATGREIKLSKKIPQKNVLSFAQSEHPWIVHTWMTGVVYEAIYKRFGHKGLDCLKLLLVFLTWICLFLTTKLLSDNRWIRAFFLLFGLSACSFRLTLRPHLFSNLLFSFAFYVYVRFYFVRAEKSKSVQSSHPQLLFLSILSVLIALDYQFHSGAFFTFVLVGIFLFGRGLSTLGNSSQKGFLQAMVSTKRLVLALFCGLSFAAVVLLMFHPAGLKVMLVPFQLGLDPYLHKHVIEFRPAYSFSFFVLKFYWVFLFVVLCLLAVCWKKMELSLPVLFFGIVSIRHIRQVDTFVLVAIPFCVFAFRKVIQEDRELFFERLFVVCTLLFMVAIPWVHWQAYPFGSTVTQSLWPQKSLQWLKKKQLRGQFFVSDVWGGPFLAEFYPKKKVFFDPRFEAYSKKFVTDVYQHIRYGKKNWKKLISRYDIDVFWLKYTSSKERNFQKGKPNLRQHLARSRTWSLVYFDRFGEIFLKRNGKNSELAKELSIPGVDPDKPGFLSHPVVALESLLAAKERMPMSGRLAGLLVMAYGSTRQFINAYQTRDKYNRKYGSSRFVEGAYRIVKKWESRR